MTKLRDTVKYVRSKNAGPFWVTLEIFCNDTAEYETVKASPALCPEKVAALYHLDSKDVQFYYIPSLYVIKISFPRPYPSGYRYEHDMHYGQQYRLLAEMEI